MPEAAIVSYRLGAGDGVSVEAAKWAWALGQLGFSVRTVAGTEPADVVVPGLALDAPGPPRRAAVAGALAGCDLVVAENICSLPLNPEAGSAVAEACRGRPTVLHHHDLPWQRPATAHLPPPPTDRCWRHVTINELSRRQLVERGVPAVTIYNTFDVDGSNTRSRAEARQRLGIPGEPLIVLQPTRALFRKNVPGGLGLAERLGAWYWLLGPPEDGYGPRLARVLGSATTPVLRGGRPMATRQTRWASATEVDDAYGAADVVVLPSVWEGFGNPTVEAALRHRPLAVGPFPVARELEAFGFRWFRLHAARELARFLETPDATVIETNAKVAHEHFSLADLPRRLAPVVDDVLGG